MEPNVSATSGKDLDSPSKKSEPKSKQTSPEDPKPRIVLTFRSEKTGPKSTNMKIVSTEEKLDKSRSFGSEADTPEEAADAGTPVKKNKSYESDEANSDTPPKRSVRNRNKECSDNVLANAIARKEKAYDAATPAQRPTRRIKPTPKALANKELRIGLTKVEEAAPRLEEGVQTRRSLRRRSVEIPQQVEEPKVAVEKSPKKRKVKGDDESELKEDSTSQDSDKKLSKLKRRHLSKLGLQAIDPDQKHEEPEPVAEELNEELIVKEEVDTDEEIAEEVTEAGPNACIESDEDDEDYVPQKNSGAGGTPRRSTRQHEPKAVISSPVEAVEAAEGAAAAEAACPDDAADDGAPLTGLCCCEEPGALYADPAELEEPVFCRALEMVDGLRVGCSHPARAAAGPGGLAPGPGGLEPAGPGGLARMLGPLLRAGPRAPYFLACELHARQMKKHMCCPMCGVYCSQGIFYQCSMGHLFHLECGVAQGRKQAPGCPHCGVRAPQVEKGAAAACTWRPANRACVRVRVEMHCSNKLLFLPDQRVQCTPAYMSFTPTPRSPAPLLPPLPALPALPPARPGAYAAGAAEVAGPADAADTGARLMDAILQFRGVEELVEILSSCKLDLAAGGWLAAAARAGHARAVFALHRAGAPLDAPAAAERAPLHAAVDALLEDTEEKEVEMEVDDKDGALDEDTSATKTPAEAGEKKPRVKNEEGLRSVIQYLIAAGCDVNAPTGAGGTALHAAAARGDAELCAALLAGGARPDARDAGGWTPLVWAAERDHADVVGLLLAAGAEAGAGDAAGAGAAAWAARAGAARALRALLRRQPRLADAVDGAGNTPLHIAALQNHYNCVITLLAHGARTDVENAAGALPAELCSDAAARAAVQLNQHLAPVRAARRLRVLCADISNGREPRPLPVLNECDDAAAPADFVYVTQHVTPRPVALDTTIATSQGCSCVGSCGESCECAALSVRAWWTRGRLPPAFPYRAAPMLFACGPLCRCNMKTCPNAEMTRLSAGGSLFVAAAVFRAGARGWGLRAEAAVPAGAPVATYCGELLAAPSADARADDRYMFALDVNADLLQQCADKTLLCVDAAQYGSAARFVNHSCAPNLAPVKVFTRTRDLRRPDVALFALRDIAAGEEFTFDYGDKFWSVKRKWMRCECGEPACRYPTKVED